MIVARDGLHRHRSASASRIQRGERLHVAVLTLEDPGGGCDLRHHVDGASDAQFRLACAGEWRSRAVHRKVGDRPQREDAADLRSIRRDEQRQGPASRKTRAVWSFSTGASSQRSVRIPAIPNSDSGPRRSAVPREAVHPSMRVTKLVVVTSTASASRSSVKARAAPANALSHGAEDFFARRVARLPRLLLRKSKGGEPFEVVQARS